ncbi:hypothetical protein F503_08589 [Ophiostoma piceae UAMH 11346]|uniref:2EXR domain-containing protein n=1 Tax=Ophiostoma piceae (strain UAMH 11346) TaxID=1262450 RepID=S3BPI2_OPHP1|nr:hypothetical protein F503_08589 [Ophiostoma piceae UAMH 11346]
MNSNNEESFLASVARINRRIVHDMPLRDTENDLTSEHTQERNKFLDIDFFIRYDDDFYSLFNTFHESAERMEQLAIDICRRADRLCPNLSKMAGPPPDKNGNWSKETPLDRPAQEQEQEQERVFHCFPRLPDEIQLMIWEVAAAPLPMCDHVVSAFDACALRGHETLFTKPWKHVKAIDPQFVTPAALWLNNACNRGIWAACHDSRRVAIHALRRPRLNVPCSGMPLKTRLGEILARHREGIRAMDEFNNCLFGVNETALYAMSAGSCQPERPAQMLVNLEHKLRSAELGPKPNKTLRIGGVHNTTLTLGQKEQVEQVRDILRKMYVVNESLLPTTAHAGPIPMAALTVLKPSFQVETLVGVKIYHTSGISTEDAMNFRRQEQKARRRMRGLKRLARTARPAQDESERRRLRRLKWERSERCRVRSLKKEKDERDLRASRWRRRAAWIRRFVLDDADEQ